MSHSNFTGQCLICSADLELKLFSNNPASSKISESKNVEICQRFITCACRYLEMDLGNLLIPSSRETLRRNLLSRRIFEHRVCDKCIPLADSFCEMYAHVQQLHLRLLQNLDEITRIMKQINPKSEEMEQSNEQDPLVKSESIEFESGLSDERIDPLFNDQEEEAICVTTDLKEELISVRITSTDKQICEFRSRLTKRVNKKMQESYPQVHLESQVMVPEQFVERKGAKEKRRTGRICGKLACIMCNSVPMCASVLEIHMRGHTGERPFVCSICHKSFVDKSRLNEHLRIHIEEPPFKCDICDKSFRFVKRKRLHMMSHMIVKPYPCSLCEKSFATEGNLRTHTKVHSKFKSHVCTICNKAFLRADHLRVHLVTHGERLLHQCKICLKSFKHAGYLKRHQCTGAEERRHKCSTCDADFARTEHLTRHMRLHTGEKPYSCKICNKTFTQSITRDLHEKRIHASKECNICSQSFLTSLKLTLHFKQEHAIHKCNHCEQRFVDPEGLETHQRTHFSADGSLLLPNLPEHPVKKKLHLCTICGKSFASGYNLTVHNRIHEGVKPFSCDVCGNSFRIKQGLLLHMRIHTEDKPFKCKWCPRSFRFVTGITEHERIHTGEKPFCCEVCGKSFAKRFSFTVHSRLHTGEKYYYKCKLCDKAFTHPRTRTRHLKFFHRKRECSICNESFTNGDSFQLHMKQHKTNKPCEPKAAEQNESKDNMQTQATTGARDESQESLKRRKKKNGSKILKS